MQYESLVSFEVNGIEYSAKLNYSPNGSLEMTYNYPDDIFGLKMKVSSKEFETSYGDVKFCYTEQDLNSCFGSLFKAFSAIRTKDPDTFVVNDNLMTAYYGEFTVQYDKDKEFITSVSTEEYNWNFQLLQYSRSFSLRRCLNDRI